MTFAHSWRRGCAAVGGLAIFSFADAARFTAEARDQQGENTAPLRTAGKRDPFLPPFLPVVQEAQPNVVQVDLTSKTPLQRAALDQLRLVGVIWSIDEPKALVEDGQGLGYIVTRGTLIGLHGGRVKAVEPQRVVIEEVAVGPLGKRVAREKELRLTGARSQ